MKFNTTVWVLLLSCFCNTNCGKIKMVDAPFAFNNPVGGLRSHGEHREAPLMMRFQPSKPSGPPYLIKHLTGKCFSLFSNNYKYEFCPFTNITQREQTYRWNAFHGVLGVYKDWIIVNNTFSYMHMVHGDICSGTLDREVKVELRCGEKSEIISVTEPSMCNYKMLFKSPYLCPEDVYLVYPVLSTKGKFRWKEIEESYLMKEITRQGYDKKQKKLFVDEGLMVDELQRASIVQERVKVDDHKKVKEDKIPKDAVPQFVMKSQCTEEYVKLLHEVEELRATVKKLSNITVQHGSINNVAFMLVAKNKRGEMSDEEIAANTHTTASNNIPNTKYDGVNISIPTADSEANLKNLKLDVKTSNVSIVETKKKKGDLGMLIEEGKKKKKKGDEGFLKEENYPKRNLLNRVQYVNKIKNKMKVHGRLRNNLKDSRDNKIRIQSAKIDGHKIKFEPLKNGGDNTIKLQTLKDSTDNIIKFQPSDNNDGDNKIKIPKE